MAKMDLFQGLNIPTEERPVEDASSFIGQFAAGYIEGLTTFDILGNYDIVGNPNDTSEQIARSFGSLLGFVGFGYGALAKTGYSVTAKAFKFLGNMEKAGELAKTAASIRPMLTSLPVAVGKFASTGTMRMFETSAAKEALKFTEQLAGREFSSATKGIVKSATESALFMGFASAAGSRPMNPLDIFTEDSFNQRWESFKSGVPMGVGFGLLGSAFTAQTMKKLGVESFEKLTEAKQQFLLKSMRGVSSALAMGGYAAYEGYPTELALYETLVNGVFGYRELPWYDKEAMHLMKKHKVNDMVMADWMGAPDEYLRQVEPDVPQEVASSFALSINSMYGNRLAVIETMKEALFEADAVINKIPLDQVDRSNPVATAVKLGMTNEAVLTESLGTREKEIAKAESERVRVYQEINGSNPSEEQMKEIKEGAIADTDKNIAVRMATYSSWDMVNMMSALGNLRFNNTTKTYDQIMRLQEAMRGMGEVPGKIIDVALDMREMFEKKAVDPIDGMIGIADIFREHKEAKQTGYDPLKKAIEKKFNVELAPEDSKKIKMIWYQYANSRPVDVRTYNGSVFIKNPATDKTGKILAEYSNRSYVEEQYDKDFIVVKDFVGADGKRKSINDPSVNHSKMILDQFKRGLWYVFGKKDDNKHLFLDDIKLEQTPSGNYKFGGKEFNLHGEFAQVDTILGKEQGTSLREYENDRKRFTDEAFQTVKPTEAQLAEANSVYDQLYAHNVLAWKKFLNVDSLGEIFSDKEAFSIDDVIKLNKRTQVLVDGNPKLDKSILGIDKLSARIVRWDETSEGLFKGKDGKYLDAQENGVLWMTKEKAQKMDLIGFGKLSITSANGFIGKLGLHVMTPNEETAIKSSGLNEDMLFFESAAKQAGKNERTTLHWNKEKVKHDAGEPTIEIDPTSKQPIQQKLKGSFEIPVDDIRINYGVGEDTEIKSINIIKQLLLGVEENPELSRHLFNTLSKRAFFGDSYNEGVRTAEQIEASDSWKFENKQKSVNLDQVGIPEITKVLQDKPMDIRLKQVVDYLMKHGTEEYGDEDQDEVDMLKEMRRGKSPVQDMMAAAGEHAYEPPFLTQEPIRRYFERALYKVAQDRLQRPHWKNSFKTKLGYLSPIELTSIEGFNEKSIMFGDGLEKTPITFKGEKTTLGELWKRERTADIQDFFDNIVNGRVPQSDLSGARVLKFHGFIKGGGFKSFVHPYNMKYMDGADLDGDSAVHYFGMDKKLTDYLKTPEVSERFTHEDGSVIPSIGGDPNLNSRRDISFMKNEPLGMFSPYQLALANRTANLGKSALGPGLTAALRSKQLDKYVRAKGGSIVVEIDKVKYMLRSKADRSQQKRTQTDTVNRAADAANGTAMADVDHVRAANILSVVDVYSPDGRNKLTDEQAITLLSARKDPAEGYATGGLFMNDIPVIRALYNLDNATKMQTFDGDRKELGKILNETASASDFLKKELRGISLDNIWYDSALLMNEKFKYEPNFGSFINPVSYKLVMEDVDNFFKRRKTDDAPVADFIMRMIGRSGLSFNVSRLDETEIWNDIKRTLKKRAGKPPVKDKTWDQYYLDDFIHARDIHDSALWEYLKKYSVAGGKTTEDKRADLLNELAKRALWIDSEIVQKDDTALTATWTTKTGDTRTRNFDKFPTIEQNQEDFLTSWVATMPNVRTESRKRAKWEQVNISNQLIIKNLHELSSVMTMSDAVSSFVRSKVEDGSLKQEDVETFLKEKVEPFLNKVSDYRNRLIEAQQDVVKISGGKPEDKKAMNKSFQNLVKDITKYRNGLETNQQSVFDATFISAMQPVDEGGYTAIQEAYRKNLETKKAFFSAHRPGASEDEIYRLAKNSLDGEDISYKKYLYNGSYALTPFSVGIVDKRIVREYYKRFNKISTAINQQPEGFNPADVLDKLNLMPKSFTPVFLQGAKDGEKMNIREVADKEAKRTFSSLLNLPGKKLEEYLKGEELQWYMTKKGEIRDIIVNHPELLNDFHLVVPYITSLRTGGMIHRAGEFATKQDLDFFVALMKQDVKTLKSMAVDWKWFGKQFSMIAEQLKGNAVKFDLQPYPAHVVVPGEGGKPTAVDMTVKALVAPLDYVSWAAQAHGVLKNALDAETNGMWQQVDKDGVFVKLNKLEKNLGNKLFHIAVSLIEEPIASPYLRAQKVFESDEDYALVKAKFEKDLITLKIYKEEADQARTMLEKIDPKNEGFRFSDKDGKTITMKKAEVMDYYRKRIEEYRKMYHDTFFNGENDNLIVYTGNNYGSAGTYPEVDMNKTIDKIVSHIIQTKKFPKLSKKKVTEMSISYLLNKNKIDIYASAKAGTFFGQYMSKEGRTEFQKKSDQANGEWIRSEKLWKEMSDVERNAFADKMDKAGSVFGFELYPEKQPYGDSYFPHITLSDKDIKEHLVENLREGAFGNYANLEEVTLPVLKLVSGSQSQMYDQTVGSNHFTTLKEQGDAFSSMNYNAKAERGRSNKPLKNWVKDPFALNMTLNKLTKEVADMQFAVLSNHILDGFREKQIFGTADQTKHIVNFAERYVRQSLGSPDLHPKGWEKGYQYGMESNPWKFHSDEYYVQKIQDISNSWFGGKISGEFKSLENMAKSMEFESEEVRKEWIERGKRTLAEQKLSWLSQMEAKWSLLSLLTSAKSYVTNVLSANTMTLINTSFDDWKKGYSLEAAQEIMGSENIKTLKDAYRIVGMMGGLEGQFQKEGFFHPELGQAGIKEVMDAFKRDGTKADVKGIFAKYGIADRALNAGAWFMRNSEQLGRQHSMLAHYFNAHRAFKQQGFNLQWDDPWVIQVARDGVNASQFLYSNANRPAFMGSLVGKVFHRFQLYAYNSIVFRKNVLDQARSVGILPGNEAYERFQRLAVTDMFAMGMASMIPMSIFGSALMPPYNTMTAFIKFFFGSDDKAKQDAFYGGLPYPLNVVQTVTPPSARVFVGLLNFAYDQDAEKMGQTIWSMFPGQRIIKDTWKSYDQIKNKHRNPAIAIDNMTGIPLYSSGYIIRNMNSERSQMQRYLNRYKSGAYLKDGEKNTEQDIQSYIDRMSAQ